MRAVLATVVAGLLAAPSVSAASDKSPGLALGLSIGSTVAGGLLLAPLIGDSEAEPVQALPGAVLLLTGPSWGHVYTGDIDLAIGGTLIRVIGLALIAEGSGECVASDDPYASLDDCEYEGQNTGLLVAGTIVLVGTALAEIIDAPLSARRHNRDIGVTVTPTVGSGRAGMALVGRF